ncbi:hypothetical protein VaNZ11_001333 [Volvox africanus]|uniref:VWFA domain-containing protein n=1 Tax=Volvox africanus TaxID=51714 RepID=A0ABQ5RPK8_9CHLO|nr:hypothetical protein VaNZ11_001333 [Volvox africanus]
MLVYCLDNSDAACRSEDYPCGNRLAWQLAVVRTVSRSLLAPQQGQQLGSTSNASPQLAVVSSAGRPALSIAPTSDAAALLGLDVSRLDGEGCQFLGALRLALLAVKRSSTGRVLAFLASEADLPPEQCRQLSRSFADSHISLDVVVLSPNDELPPDLTASLQLLTAIPVYDQSPVTAETGPGSNTQRPGLRRGASGSGPRTALGGRATEQPSEATTSGDGSVSSAPTGLTAMVATPGARTQVARTEEGVAASTAVMPPCGQRLLLFPPPEPSLALWQQMEPLLEMLHLEIHAGNQQPGGDGEPNTIGVEDERGVPSQLRTGSGAGRPPLPRPPRYRAGSATGSTTTAVSPGVGQRAPGLTPSGPLASRSGARGATAGTCRYESLDSLQHLSLDGFLRSWLPSYANFSRVLQLPPATTAQQQQQQQQQGGGAGEGAGGGGATSIRSTADADGAAAGLGPGRLCYISVYRLQLPRWHKLCEVHAGCMYEVDLPEGAEPSATGSATAPDGAVADAAALTECLVSTGQSESQATAALQPSAQARPAVVVPRAPCPVQIHFSTKCSSAAAAAAAAGSDSTAAGSSCHWVYPDLRRGSLSLVASVEDPGVVKLLWNERQRANAQQQPQYGSIFATAEESNDSVEPTTAELELTLSPTRSQFRVVTHAKGGAVLEVLYPRSCVHRPRPSSSNAGSQSAPQHNAQRARGGTVQRGSSTASVQTSAQPSHHHSHHHHSQQQQHHDRYFFWLQQDWHPEVAAAEAAAPVPAGKGPATKAGSGCVGEDGSVDSGGTGRNSPLSDRGCRALAEHLQALLECPPEFDPQKHGCRVRCSSTPLQLGPLPFALVEEIMRASGRQLHPDGTLAVATTARSAFSAAAAAAPSNHPTTAAGAAATARMQTLHQQLQQAGSRRTASGTQGKGGELCRGPGGVVVMQRDRTADGQGSGADGMCNLAQSRSAAALAGASAAANSAASAPKRPATKPPLVAAPGPAAAGDADVPGGTARARSTTLSDMRGSVPGFSRTTYSRASSVHGDWSAIAQVVSALTRPEKLKRLEAARALSSHPLEDTEWGSDCDSRAEGASSGVSSGAATPRSQNCFFSGKDLSRPETGMAAIAGSDDSDPGALDIGDGSLTANSADSASAASELSPAGAPHLPSGCTRGGLAAVAAAAAAVGSSGPPLVAAVEPEAGGSCTEDSSLMFELD